VTKVEDMNGQMVPYLGISPEKFRTLAELIQKVLTRKDHAIVCIKGNKGVGKTTLGNLIRKGEKFLAKSNHIKATPRSHTATN